MSNFNYKKYDNKYLGLFRTEKEQDFRRLFIGLDTLVKLKDGSETVSIGFDNGATTPSFKCVIDAIYENLLTYGSIGRGNGQKGEISSDRYEKSRDIVLKFFNLEDSSTHTVVYTKTATESLNLLANILIKNKSDKILTTRMEHHANDLPWRNTATVEYIEVDELGRIRLDDIENKLIANKGSIKYISITGASNVTGYINPIQVEYIEVDELGRIRLDDIENKLIANKGSIKYISITGASNVTGYINPIHEVAKLAHKYGAKIIVDGAQLVAHKEVDMKGKDKSEVIDFLVFSSHKAYSPFGSGAIVGLSEDLENVEPFLRGGGCVDCVLDDMVIWSEQPSLHEAGSPNFIGVMAMVTALEKLKEIGLKNVYEHERELKEYLIKEMKQIDNVILYGDTENTDDRIGVIPFNIKCNDKDCYDIAQILADEYAIALRSGKFCAHPYVNRLLKISDSEAYEYNLNEDELGSLGMIRLSIGLYNTIEEAEIFLEALKRIAMDN